jgi:hypothetical protein
VEGVGQKSKGKVASGETRNDEATTGHREAPQNHFCETLNRPEERKSIAVPLHYAKYQISQT